MKKFVFAAVIAFAFGPVLAAEPYVGASVGRTQQKAEVSGGSLGMSSTSLKVFGGYQFDNGFGLEGGYTRFGEASLSSDGMGVSIKPDTFYAAATGRVALAPTLSAYAKLGIARPGTTGALVEGGSSETMNTRRTTPLVGVGVTHALSKEMAVFAEYEYYGKAVKEGADSLKLDNLSVGVRYSF